MDERQRAYLDLLGAGLVAIRNHAHAGHTAFCEIEADHIHNIPSLLFEPNEHRHRYYIIQERDSYLKQLSHLAADEYARSMKVRFADSWKSLASRANVELSD